MDTFVHVLSSSESMRIANRKRFMFSCVFFTLFMLLFVKSVIMLKQNKTIKPNPVVMAVDKKACQKKNIVVLDAGHGGVDKGTSYKNMYEKNLTLKIVKYVEVYLKNTGYEVVLTRNSDELIPLKEIGNKVNAAGAKAFVSIHVNSLNDTNFKGITTFYYDVNGYEKEERMKFANIIENEVIKSDNWENKGIKKQNIAVLRYSEIPCALVECGFITNAQDRDKLNNDEVLKRLGKNISNGIIKYLEEN